MRSIYTNSEYDIIQEENNCDYGMIIHSQNIYIEGM